MPSEIFQISLERIKQQLYRQSEERKIRLGAFSDDRIHDWIQTLDEASGYLRKNFSVESELKSPIFPTAKPSGLSRKKGRLERGSSRSLLW